MRTVRTSRAHLLGGYELLTEPPRASCGDSLLKCADEVIQWLGVQRAHFLGASIGCRSFGLGETSASVSAVGRVNHDLPPKVY